MFRVFYNFYKGLEQIRQGWMLGDKGTGSGRAGYRKWEVLTLSPPNFMTFWGLILRKTLFQKGAGGFMSD